MTHSGVQGKMARGAAWMMLLNFTERTLGLINMSLLAHMLVPADFGICAMAGSFIAMAQMFTAFGFDVALIQNQAAQEADYHTAWTFNVIVGVAILFLMLGLAGPIATFYKEPEVFWVVCALAFAPLIVGCENIGVVAFRKELDFRKEFRFQISRKLVSFLVTISLAFWLRNYWALVAGMLASRMTGTITSYLMHPFRPRFSLAARNRLFSVSKWLLVNNIVSFLKQSSPDFIIGRMSGPVSLGIYNVSSELAHLPQNELAGPVNRALLPGYSKLLDLAATKSAYANSLRLIGLATIPASCGILAVASFLIPVVLGQKWIEGVPLMQVLAVSGAFHVFHASMSSLLIAKGFVASVTGINLIFVSILIASMAVVVPRYGLLGAAYVTLAVTILSTPMFLFQLRLRLQVPIWLFASAVARPVIAAVFMIFVIRMILPEYTVMMPKLIAVFWLVTGVLLGAVTYGVTIVLLWIAVGRPAGAEQLVLEKVKLRLKVVMSKKRRDDTSGTAD